MPKAAIIHEVNQRFFCWLIICFMLKIDKSNAAIKQIKINKILPLRKIPRKKNRI